MPWLVTSVISRGGLSMRHRLLFIVLLLTMLFSLTGSAWASPPEATALLQVFVPDTGAMERFAATGLPAYTFFDDTLLTGISTARLSLLDASGLDYRLLDADMRGGHYYLTYLRPNQATPAWEDYGRLLLEGDNYALLRSTPEVTSRLASTGIGFRAITLTPKPLPNREAAVDLFPDVVTPDPFVQQLIDQVTESEISDLTAGLSGVVPVTINDAPYTILTRYTYSGEPIQKATQYVGEYLSDLGLAVEYHTWQVGTPPNVIGKIPGLVNPRNIYIIGGHLDDMPTGLIAPGADDNASGSVATMLAAKLFSQYYWGCTLRFAFWTGEEQGLLGSYEYAERSRLQKETILGYLNLDMIAWNSDNRPGIDLYAWDEMPATLDLAYLFSDTIAAYALKLDADIFDTGMGASDHASFWDFNYVSILAIEDDNDFNDYYHTTNDQLQYLNIPYYTEFVKASLATFAHMSNCLLPTGSLDGTVSVDESGEPIPGASLIFTDTLGHSFDALTDATGYYSSLLPAGIYTATVTAEGYSPVMLTGITIVADTLVIQDFELSLVSEPWIVYLPLSLRNDSK
jgi:hypothetical protein